MQYNYELLFFTPDGVSKEFRITCKQPIIIDNGYYCFAEGVMETRPNPNVPTVKKGFAFVYFPLSCIILNTHNDVNN